MANIACSGSFMPSGVNTPIDARCVINYVNEITNIQNPFIGMIVYVKNEDDFYVITSLKASNVAGIVVENALVSGYRKLCREVVQFATDEEITNMLNEIGL